MIGTLDSATSSVDRWIAAVFTEVEWSVTETLNVTTGVRYNDDELFGGHITPRVYANYHLTPAWTFKGGVSTGYKQPSLPEATEGFGRQDTGFWTRAWYTGSMTVPGLKSASTIWGTRKSLQKVTGSYWMGGA